MGVVTIIVTYFAYTYLAVTNVIFVPSQVYAIVLIQL